MYASVLATDAELEQDALSKQLFAQRMARLVEGHKEIARRRKNFLAQLGTLDGRDLADPTNAPLRAVLVGKLDQLWVDLYQLTADALASVDEDGELHETYSRFDVERWCQRAIDMGASHPRLDLILLGKLARMDRVPNAPLREHLEYLLSRGVRDLNWYASRVERFLRIAGESHRKASGARIKAHGLERMLGIKTHTGKGSTSSRLFITHKQAAACARAFGMSYQQAGV